MNNYAQKMQHELYTYTFLTAGLLQNKDKT